MNMIGSTAGNAVILRLRLFPGGTAPFRLAIIASLCAQFEAFANSDPTATSMPSRHLEFVRRICTLYMQVAARSLTLSMVQPKRIDRHPFFANWEWRKFRMLETALFIFMQGHLTFIHGKYAHCEEPL
jgi:hypothetical protein